MDVIYMKFELIDFSVKLTKRGLNPCIKNRTKKSGHKETTEIKSTYQQRNRRDRKIDIQRVYPS